jgi:hypothetical protein
LISTSSFANPPVDEKISSRFKETFPNASNEKWYEYEGFYEVLFQTNDISCRMKYDMQGHIISVRRDYTEKDLSLYILAKLKAKYTGKKIFGVTEITTEGGTNYNIVLEDEKHWITVKSDATGNMSIAQKLKKA